jgi:hypothetical protein
MSSPITTTHRGRNLTNIGLLSACILLFLTTRKWESLITIILPGAAIHWMISNEQKLSMQRQRRLQVDRKTMITLLGVPMVISILVVIFYIPRMSMKLNSWTIYAIASFSLGFLLVNLYGRYVAMRKPPRITLPPL